MATSTVKPNGDGTVVNWTSSGGGSLYLMIDEGISSADDATTYIRQGSSTGSAYFLLEDFPANFGTATAVTVTVRHTVSTTKGDRKGYTLRLYQSDESTAITSATSQQNPPQGYATSSPISLTITGATNKTAFDGARLRITGVGTSGNLDISAIDVEVTYTSSAQTYDETGSGGAVAGTTATVQFTCTLVGTGGSVAGGESFVQLITPTVFATGGAVAGGAAVEEHDFSQEWNEVGTGGSVAGGSASIGGRTFIVTTGGAVAGGTASLTGTAEDEGSGGSVAGGTSTVMVLKDFTATGGTVADGGSVKNFRQPVEDYVLVYDTFWDDIGLDLSEHISDSGDAWISDGWQIGSAESTGEGAFALVDAGESDYHVSASIMLPAPENAGIVVRYAAADSYWLVRLDTNYAFRIIEYQAGLEIPRAFATVVPDPSIIEIEVYGTSLVAYCGGTAISATMGTFLTETTVGLWAEDAGVSFLEFTATDALQMKGRGGTVAGGAASVGLEYSQIATGGVVCSGDAQEFSPYFNVGSGGVVCGGTAQQGARYPEVAEGGAVAGGEALDSILYRITTTGGTVAGGSSTVFVILTPAVSGGAVAGGTGTVRSSNESQLGESLRLYYTGADEFAGEQEEPSLSLGGFRSFTLVQQAGVFEAIAIPNLVVMNAGGANTEAGTIGVTGDSVAFTAQGGSLGDGKELLVGFPEVLEDGSDPNKWIQVKRTTSGTMRGISNLEFTNSYNTLFEDVDVGATTKYRALMLCNYSLFECTSIRLHLLPLASTATCTGGLPSSGSGTLYGDDFSDWPFSGHCRIDGAGGDPKEVVYYSSRTETSLNVVARGLHQSTAVAGVAGDILVPIPSCRIGIETPVANEIQTIANENTAPTAITFSNPYEAVHGIAVASLDPNEQLGVWLERELPSGVTATPESEIKIGIQFVSDGVTYNDVLKSLFRIEDDSLARYEMHVGVGEEPDTTATPDETWTSTPHEVTYSFTPDETYYIRVNQRNKWGLISEQTTSTILNLDGDGEEIDIPPTAPDSTIAATSTGAFNIISYWMFSAFDPDIVAEQVPSTYYFRIYVSYNGTDPLLQTPIDVAGILIGGRYALDYTSADKSIPTTARAVVRILRVEDEVESQNITEITATSATTAFGTPLLKGFSRYIAEHK